MNLAPDSGMPDTHAPAGWRFTLRDLFVTLTVVGILVGLLSMVLNSARQAKYSEQRGTCIGNMNQLSQGLQAHVDVWRALPPLYWGRNSRLHPNPPLSPLDASGMYSWQVRLLPFIEEGELYRNIHGSSAKFASDSTHLQVYSPQSNGRISPSKIRIPALQCPSVPDNRADGNCNYAALSATRLPLLLEVEPAKDGLPDFKQEPDGMLIPDRAMHGQPLARMVDGASKTAVLIESREPTRSNWYDPQQAFVVGFLPSGSGPVDLARSDYFPRFNAAGGWQFNSAAGNRTALNHGPTSGQPKNIYYGNTGDPLERSWGPSSAHEGRITVGMGDGSWRELDENIDPAVFFSLITVGGAESLTPPWE
jgi:hypothetical protein